MLGWLLKCQLREKGDSDIIEAILPMSPDREYILSQRKRPVALLQRIRHQVIAYMGPQLPHAAHLSLEQNMLELNRIFGRCERVSQEILHPPTLYCACDPSPSVLHFLLPFALATAGVHIAAHMVTTGAVAFALMELDEIGHILEQRFR
jgi:predicted membrane chloride channel (bestrophin family)